MTPASALAAWLDLPAIQGGVAPLVVALLVAVPLAFVPRRARLPLAWLAVLVAYLVTVALAFGFGWSPLTAGRKTVLLAVAGVLAALVVDAASPRRRAATMALALALGAASVWVFWSLYVQRPPAMRAGLALAGGVFTAAMIVTVTRLRADGVRAAATGLGLGVATGVASLLSASIGNLLAGVGVATGCGALLAVQVLARRNLPAGVTGSVAIALTCSLLALGSILLAEMPWFVLALLWLVPLLTGLPRLEALSRMPRAAALASLALLVALLPIAAAWYAAGASST